MKSLSKITTNKMNVSGVYARLLQTQAQGLTGHIDEIWEDLGKESSWLGGTKEDWERGPYYFDGLVELAFLIRDENLLKKVKYWVDAICDSQEASGFFGPKSNQDWWPRILATKGLLTYYQHTLDKRIIWLLERFFCYMEKQIQTQPLYFWAFVRGMEIIPALECVIEVTKNADCINLLKNLQSYTHDWEKTFLNFPYPKKTKYYLNRFLFLLTKPIFVLLEKWNKNKIKTKESIINSQKNYFNQQFLLTHGVNIAMAIKYLAYSNSKVDIARVLDQLQQYHGNATMVFSSDEHLNGPSPLQGMELCTAAELIFSLEEVIRYTKDLFFADQAEWIATNMLPAFFTKDICAHQYIQQVNQSSAGIKKGPFFDVGKAGTMFGIAPHFGCCAANMHQAFPKFVRFAVLVNQEELYFAFYIAGKYQAKDAIWEVETDYPFSDVVCIRFLEGIKKKIHLRIPYQAKTTILIDEEEVLVEKQKVYSVWVQANSVIKMRFDFPVEVMVNPDRSYSIKRGPILFAQELKAIKQDKKGVVPYQDRVYYTLDNPHIPFNCHHELEVKQFSQQVDLDSFYGCNAILDCVGRNKKTNKEELVQLVWYGRTILRWAQWERR